MAWPALGPIFPDDPNVDLTGGHPTVPGDLDKKTIRRAQEPSPGNGFPGKPRYKTFGKRRGPGLPGPTPSGPIQPGVDYDDGSTT